MRIVVTGANGFLGSWICRILRETCQVFPFVRPGSNIDRLIGQSSQGITFCRDEDFNNTVRNVSPEVIVLCDWWGVSNHHRNDNRQFENVKRLRNRLEALGRIENVIGVGSQAEVGPVEKPINEEIFDSPTTIYGEAKVQARNLLNTYLKGNSRFVWARIFSTYGPLDWDGWFIPSLIRSMIDGKSIPLTKGEQEWSFLHSYDLAKAFETIVFDARISGVVNIGNSQTVNIYEVAYLVAAIFGRSDLIRLGDLPYRPDQVMRLFPLTTKLTNSGWNPKVNLNEGLSHLTKWMSGEADPFLNLNNGKSIRFGLPNYAPMK
jgi:nucleoside-diphosphate-sugar epimerase